MLQVIAAEKASVGMITIDHDLPLAWCCDSDPVPLFWRTGDLTRSLLEIGLVPATGRLCTVTIVSTMGHLRRDEGKTAAALASSVLREGLTCCETHPWLDRHVWPDMRSGENQENTWMLTALRWEERFLDEAAAFEITINPQGVSVSTHRATPP